MISFRLHTDSKGKELFLTDHRLIIVEVMNCPHQELFLTDHRLIIVEVMNCPYQELFLTDHRLIIVDIGVGRGGPGGG